MLRRILFDLNLFEDESARDLSQKGVLGFLQALTYWNQLYLRLHPDTPLIYQSGIEYKIPEQYEGGIEHFRDIGRIIDNGGGDCDNVACWRAAELREMGIDARPFITWRKRADGGTTYHVVVLYGNGTHEDPSLLLGMGGDAKAEDRAEEERKLGERTAEFMKVFAIKKNLEKAKEAVFGNMAKTTVLGGVAVTTPQNFNQLQYTIPFQTDDSYEDWSPTRPQAFYANPLYPNLPSTPGGGPIINTRWRDPDDIDGDVAPLLRSKIRRLAQAVRKMRRAA